jgi:hypothetical protein
MPNPEVLKKKSVLNIIMGEDEEPEMMEEGKEPKEVEFDASQEAAESAARMLVKAIEGKRYDLIVKAMKSLVKICDEEGYDEEDAIEKMLGE